MKNKLFLTLLIPFFISCQSNKTEDFKTLEEDPEARTLIINADEINKKIKKGRDIAYKNATIMGDINFLNAREVNLELPYLIKHYINSSVLFSKNPS